jgi:hypothetical protein
MSARRRLRRRARGAGHDELRAALRRAVPEDDGARERSWRVVQASFASRERPPRRRRWAWLIVVAALTPVAAAGVAAASAPHSDVGRWVRGVLGVGQRDARPVLGHVPGGGRLLVQAGSSAWVVASDGAKRRLGAYAGTSWSPHGLFVVGWRGRELTALEPGGAVRWSLSPRERVASASWGPVDGYRIAYVAGSQLRIVWGNGSHDRRYGVVRAAVTPAWRPDDRHVLAYADASTRRGASAASTRGRGASPASTRGRGASAASSTGMGASTASTRGRAASRASTTGRGASGASYSRVRVVAVDSRRLLWASARLEDVRALAWSPTGRRLLVVTGRRLILFDRSGRRLVSRAIPAGFAVTAAAWSPRGREIALVRRNANGSLLMLADAAHGLSERLLFSGPGRFGAPAWSPDAGRLLLPWPDADQWLFLRPHGGGPLVTAVGHIATQFGPGRLRPAFPRGVQWCC